MKNPARHSLPKHFRAPPIRLNPTKRRFAHPANHYTSFKAINALRDLGLLTYSSGQELFDEGFIDDIHRYYNLFIFDHSGVTIRRPNSITREALNKRDENGDISDESIQILYSAPRPEKGKGIVEQPGLCRMQPILAPGFYPAAKRLKLNRNAPQLLPGSQEEKEYKLELKDLRKMYRAGIPFDGLIRHLIGHHIAGRFATWLFLQSSSYSRTNYFVIDLDDKTEKLRYPKAPSEGITLLLKFLESTILLDPKNAFMVSSPGGLGRHLYYRLDKFHRASEIGPAVRGFLRFHLEKQPNRESLRATNNNFSGIENVDIFPIGHNRNTMSVLPLGRGSFICDHTGNPSIFSGFRTNFGRALDAAETAAKHTLSLNQLRSKEVLRFELAEKAKNDNATATQTTSKTPTAAPNKVATVPAQTTTHDAQRHNTTHSKPPTKPTRTPSSVRKLITIGLTGPGQRYHAIKGTTGFAVSMIIAAPFAVHRRRT